MFPVCRDRKPDRFVASSFEIRMIVLAIHEACDQGRVTDLSHATVGHTFCGNSVERTLNTISISIVVIELGMVEFAGEIRSHRSERPCFRKELCT